MVLAVVGAWDTATPAPMSDVKNSLALLLVNKRRFLKRSTSLKNSDV